MPLFGISIEEIKKKKIALGLYQLRELMPL